MIKLSSGNGQFQMLPEGEHILKVTKVDYREKYHKMTISYENKDGIKYQDNFTFADAKGNPIEGGINAFSFTAKILLDDFDVEEIDEQDLVGKYMLATVVHSDPVPSKNDPTRMVRFARITNKAVCNGWDDDEEFDDDDLEDDVDLDEEM